MCEACSAWSCIVVCLVNVRSLLGLIMWPAAMMKHTRQPCEPHLTDGGPPWVATSSRPSPWPSAPAGLDRCRPRASPPADEGIHRQPRHHSVHEPLNDRQRRHHKPSLKQVMLDDLLVWFLLRAVSSCLLLVETRKSIEPAARLHEMV